MNFAGLPHSIQSDGDSTFQTISGEGRHSGLFRTLITLLVVIGYRPVLATLRISPFSHYQNPLSSFSSVSLMLWPSGEIGSHSRLVFGSAYGLIEMLAGWRNWQTQRSQKPPRAISYRFDSDTRHHLASSPKINAKDSPG